MLRNNHSELVRTDSTLLERFVSKPSFQASRGHSAGCTIFSLWKAVINGLETELDFAQSMPVPSLLFRFTINLQRSRFGVEIDLFVFAIFNDAVCVLNWSRRKERTKRQRDIVHLPAMPQG
jgi:hypothetical protein